MNYTNKDIMEPLLKDKHNSSINDERHSDSDDQEQVTSTLNLYFQNKFYILYSH